MSHAVSMPPAVTPCSLHRRHSPQPWTTEMHHVVLESWTEKLALPHSRIVGVCPTAHDAIHVAIRLTIQDRPLPYRLSSATRALVNEAVAFWNAHPAALTLADLLPGG